MKRKKRQPSPDDYVLLPSVTHPRGRHQAFLDAFHALVRAMIEVNHQPALAYASDKTHRIVTDLNINRLSSTEIAEWKSACAEFDAMSKEQQTEWIEKVVSTYPKLDELPDIDSYNLIH